MMDRDSLLLEQWRKASELHLHEDNLTWEKVKYFFAVNSGLIAVASLLTGSSGWMASHVNQSVIGTGLALFGTLAALIWTLVQRRGRWYHRYRVAQACQAEIDLKLDDQRVLTVIMGWTSKRSSQSLTSGSARYSASTLF